MKKNVFFIIALTGELIFSNYILSLVTLLNDVNFKGGTVHGIGKNFIFIGFSLFLIIAVIGQINDSISSRLKNNELYKMFFVSPLFFLWIIMGVYLMSIEYILKYLSFKFFWMIYMLLCIQLFFLQKRMILNLWDEPLDNKIITKKVIDE